MEPILEFITNFDEEVEIGGTTKTNYEWIRDDLKAYTASYKNDNYSKII